MMGYDMSAPFDGNNNIFLDGVNTELVENSSTGVGGLCAATR